MSKYLSKCHQAPLRTTTDEEGTSYFICSECDQPADIYQPDNIELAPKANQTPIEAETLERYCRKGHALNEQTIYTAPSGSVFCRPCRTMASAKYRKNGRKPQNRLPRNISFTVEYGRWLSMKQRCNNPNAVGYHRYGGRGIKVCPEWEHDFMAFYADMGQRPSPKHSLDRIDNNKGYSPENCRWATRKEQQRNTRSNIFLTYKGKRQTLVEWAEETGIAWNILHTRYRTGKSVEEILTKPNDDLRQKLNLNGGGAKNERD